MYYEEILAYIFSEPNDVVVVILSQEEGYHAVHADYTRKRIYEQASALEKVCYIILKSLRYRHIKPNLYTLLCYFLMF